MIILCLHWQNVTELHFGTSILLGESSQGFSTRESKAHKVENTPTKPSQKLESGQHFLGENYIWLKELTNHHRNYSQNSILFGENFNVWLERACQIMGCVCRQCQLLQNLARLTMEQGRSYTTKAITTKSMLTNLGSLIDPTRLAASTIAAVRVRTGMFAKLLVKRMYTHSFRLWRTSGEKGEQTRQRLESLIVKHVLRPGLHHCSSVSMLENYRWKVYTVISSQEQPEQKTTRGKGEQHRNGHSFKPHNIPHKHADNHTLIKDTESGWKWSKSQVKFT